MKRIVYIANIRFPTEKAHGYQIAKMCEQFAAAGINVQLIVPTRRTHVQTDAYTLYGVRRIFAIKKLRLPDFIFYDRWLLRRGIWLQRWGFFFAVVWLRIRRDTIVYTRDPEVVLACRLKRIPVVFESHHIPERNARLFIASIGMQTRIVTVTKAIRNFFIQHGVSQHLVTVAPDGVDNSIFASHVTKHDARTQLDLPATHTIIIYTGSFTTMGSDKGIADIIQALVLLSAKNRPLLFVAVGGSDDDIKTYTQHAQQCDMLNHVRLLPPVDRPTLALYQRASDVLMMPFPDTPHYRYSMSPLKMFEYMASGRPIIASSLPSIHEVLTEASCFFCQPDNPQDIAQTLQYVLQHPEEAEARAVHARQMVKRFSWAARVKTILEHIA